MGGCEYEAERSERIRRNERILQELGLEDGVRGSRASASSAGLTKSKRGAGSRGCSEDTENGGTESEERAPQRRSSRLRGEAVSKDAFIELDERRVEKAIPVRKTMALRTIVDPDQLDAHNHFRIRSMSEVALRRRIWKIRREDKMVSFIKVLLDCAEPELAAEAENALAALRGEPVKPPQK